MSIFTGASVVMTGGASGIGRALSLELARRGARVHVTDINEQGAVEVAQEIGGAKASRLDVRDPEAVRRLIEDAASAYGRLDFLFNNAGIGLNGEAQELTLGHWERILDVNVRGVIHGVQAAYPIMVRQGSGHIINTASMAGLFPMPLLTPYAMTKHAVVGLSTSLRIEAAALGVKVSALCPEVIETPILDSINPPDLPPLSWRPNVRRFLTRMGGTPYPADKLAAEALNGVEQNKAIIVSPLRGRINWALGRLVPSLVERLGRSAVAAERSTRGQ
jgi:NAD(P)-dependent dehydrogenase (short-subunit alcohol dehydrogenase family)